MSVAAASSKSANPYGIVNGDSKSKTADNTSAQGIQDRFLKLLVTQLKQQDPMNPMENSQMTTQMAQISQVSGLEKLNKSMEGLTQAQASAQSMTAANVIGREVLVPSNSLQLPENGSAQASVSLAEDADMLTVGVKDQNGLLIDSYTMDNPKAGMNGFAWDGKDSLGKRLPAGDYTIEAQASKKGEDGVIGIAATPYSNQKVSAVSWDKGSPQLVLPDNSRVQLSDVAQLSS